MLTKKQREEVLSEMPDGMTLNYHFEKTGDVVITFAIYDFNGITQEIIVDEEETLLNIYYVRELIYKLIKRIPAEQHSLVGIDKETYEFLESIYG